MIATVPLPPSSGTACSPMIATGREVVDAVEGEPLRLRRVGVPGDDRDARVDGAVDRVGEKVAVQARDRDAVHVLRDERLEDLLLPQLVRASRARAR